MEDNQKKGGQQKTSAKRGRTLAGIIVLIILGLVGNRFMGDEGKETGQDNYLADVTITGAPTQALLPEEDGEPSGSGEMDKPDKVPSGADDKDEPDKAPSGTEDKEESDKASSGTDEEESDKAPSGTDKEESDKAPSGTDKEESDKAPSGTDEEESDKAPSGTEDKEESDKAPSGTDEEESDKAPSGTDGEDGKGEPEADDKDGGEIEILYEFRRESYLEQHFDKHGNEFDYATKEEYLEGANRVIQSPDALHKIEAEDGDDIYYLEETNEFVVVSTDGYIRTYFRPSAGINYYNRQ